jgi:predicted RNA-binding protein (virulence factor B family)
MIRPGHVQDLFVRRHTADGWVLADGEGNEVLYPEAKLPTGVRDDKSVRVFVLRDDKGRLVATTRIPKATVGQFAMFRVLHAGRDGAYLDWGLKPDLFVPAGEQQRPLQEGRWALVRVVHDREHGLFASTRVEDFLDNRDLRVEEQEEVDLIVFDRSDLGLDVVVNGRHRGLVHASDVFKPVSVGDRMKGFVRHIREDHKLDITLQPIGFRQYNDANVELLIKRLRSGRGFLPFTDKSSTEAIYAEFGISKKAFKKAVGSLYRERLVRLEDDGIVWIGGH